MWFSFDVSIIGIIYFHFFFKQNYNPVFCDELTVKDSGASSLEIRDNMSSVLVIPSQKIFLNNQTEVPIWRMLVEENVGPGSDYSSPVLAVLYFAFLVSVILLSVLASYWSKRGETSVRSLDSAPPSYTTVVFAEPPPRYEEIINVYQEEDNLIIL